MRRFLLCLSLLFFCLFSVDAQKKDSLRMALSEVTVTSKENPAYHIIRQAVRNRNTNSPYHNNTFQCVLYQKLVAFPSLNDSVHKKKMFSFSVVDTADSNEENSFFENHYLFINESVTKYYFKQDNKESRQLIASKTAGSQDPLFSIMLSKIQLFSFYQNDYVEIGTGKFVNPVSYNGTIKYDFQLVDTLYSNTDTVFVIRYAPKPHAAFNSLQGTLFISSDNYAIKEITACSADRHIDYPLSVHHIYCKKENGTWFPDNIEAKMKLPLISVNARPVQISVNTTVKEIETDIIIKNKIFNNVMLRQTEERDCGINDKLPDYRDTILSQKEIATYQLFDSIGKRVKIDRKLDVVKKIMGGYMSVGPVDVDIKSIINFNNYQGWKFGLGLYTNDHLTRHVHFGGYFNYCTKVAQWAWGARSTFYLNRAYDMTLRFQYSDDFRECSQILYPFRDYTLFDGYYYRGWLASAFDRTKTLNMQFKTKVINQLAFSAIVDYSQNRTCFNYDYGGSAINAEQPFAYNNFSVKLAVRLAFKETVLQAANFTYLEVSPFPVIIFEYTQGIKGVFGSHYNYRKYNLYITHKQVYKRLGFSQFTIMAGYTPNPLPSSLLFSAPGGYSMVGLYGKELFGAMRINEFLSSSYLHLFLSHNFGKIVHNKIFSPQFVICQNIGFGSLNNKNLHAGISFKTMEKGYFETGILVEDMAIFLKIFSVGVGVFYRYGFYAYPKIIDNFAFKIRLSLVI